MCPQPLAMLEVLEPRGRKWGRWGLTLKGILGPSPSFLLFASWLPWATSILCLRLLPRCTPSWTTAESWTETRDWVEPASQTKWFLFFIVCFRYVVPAWSADSHSCVAITVLILRNLCSSSPAWFVNHNVTLLHTEDRTVLSVSYQSRT